MAAWIASWRDSHASRTAWPEAEKARTTIDGSGRQLRTAFAELSPDSSSWRTYPACDLLGDSPLFSQTWPRSGSVSNGIASERPTLELATNGSEFSSLAWPTPDVCSAVRDMSKVNPDSQRAANTKRTVGLPTIASKWATPDCNTSTKSNGLMGPNIREQAASFSPVSTWPTPASRDQKGENGDAHMQNGTGRLHLDQLPIFVKFRFSPPDPAAPHGLESSETTDTSRRRLNPAFVCWLMGWPWFWTNPGRISFAAQETALWRCRLQSRLSSLLGEPELLEDAA